MGIFGRRAGKPASDVTDLRLANDVAGLVTALESPSATVVRDAASAIGSVFRSEPDPARTAAAQAGPPLLRALGRMTAVAARPADPSAIDANVDAMAATWAVIDTLGAIGACEAASALGALLVDPAAEPGAREHAAIALGEIGNPTSADALLNVIADPSISRAVVLTGQGDALAAAAARGLAGLGEAGVVRLASLLDQGGPTAQAALAALRTVEPDRPGGERARRAVADFDQRATEAAARERADRESAEAAARERWAAEHPQAAALALRLGHPDWLVEGGFLRPSAYPEAVGQCWSMGLAVEEHEDVVDDEMADVWATVTVDGVSVLLDGGRRFRDVHY